MVKPKPVNLISSEFIRRSFPGKVKGPGLDRRALIVLVVLAGIAFSMKEGVAVVTLSASVAESKRKVQTAKTKLSQMQSQLVALEKSRAELTKEEATQNQRLEFLRSTLSRETNYSQLLAQAAALVPEELWINQFVGTEKTLEIQGTSFHPELITQFMNQLNDSGLFRNSNFASSERQMLDAKAVYNFQITTEPVWEVLAGRKNNDAASGLPPAEKSGAVKTTADR